MISVEKICYHYRGYPDTLQDVSFQMNGGEFLAVLGNNGVGKVRCSNASIIFFRRIRGK